MENLEEKRPLKSRNYTQWIAVFSAFVLIFQLGIFNGWSSPNFAWLISEESSIKATNADLSWIASLSSVGAAVGSIFGAIFMEYYGTRKTLLLVYLFLGVGQICLLMANSIEWIYVARITSSIPTSIMLFSCSMYLGEISSPEIRGTLISIVVTASPLGTVLVTIAETYLSMKVSNSIYLSAVLLGVMLMLWLKDTPYFFMKKNDLKGAIQSIEFYHADKDIEKEFAEIKSFAEESKSQSFKDKIQELRSPVIKKSMLAMFMLCGLASLSGYNILLNYMEIILKSAKFNLVKPHEFVIYATIIKLLATSSVIKLVDKVGRKVSLILTCIFTSIAMLILGLHFYLLKAGFDEQSLQALPLVSIVIYLGTYAAGYVMVPNTVLSEVFPEKLKSIAVFVACLSGSLFSFIATKSYQPYIDIAGEEYAFWTFSLLSLIGIPCALFLMIETKGKSFQEIQNKLTKKWHV